MLVAGGCAEAALAFAGAAAAGSLYYSVYTAVKCGITTLYSKSDCFIRKSLGQEITVSIDLHKT